MLGPGTPPLLCFDVLVEWASSWEWKVACRRDNKLGVEELEIASVNLSMNTIKMHQS